MDIKTDCNGCCFAEMEPNEGLVQVGCKLGRLDIFRKLGINLEECKDETGGISYYSIKNRICNAKRNNEWYKANHQFYVEKLQRELEPTIDVIIVVENGANIEKLEETFNSIKCKIGTLHVIHNSDDISYGAIRIWIAEKFKDTKQVWYTSFMVEKPRLDFYKTVDVRANALEHSFYLAIPAGETVPPTLFSWLNTQLNVELRQLGLVYPSEGMWYLSSSKISKYVNHNEPEKMILEDETEIELPNLPSKIQYWANSTGNDHMIEEFNEPS